MPATAESAVAVVPKQKEQVAVIERELVRLAPQIARQLPNGMSEERFQTVTLQALAKNPDLLACDPASVILAVLDAASVGLEPTGVLSQAWLVPFRQKDAGKSRAQLMIGYNGYRTLARRSGEVSSIEARVVYEGDHFEVHYGSDQRIVHRPSFENDPATITHAYAITRMKDGTQLFDIMTRAELDGIRARSRSANKGPWVTDTAEMDRKTVIRRHVKALPLTVEATRVIERDDEAEFGAPGQPVVVQSRATHVKGLLAARKAPTAPPEGPGAPEGGSTPPESADGQETTASEVCGSRGPQDATCAGDPDHEPPCANADGTVSWTKEAAE